MVNYDNHQLTPELQCVSNDVNHEQNVWDEADEVDSKTEYVTMYIEKSGQ